MNNYIQIYKNVIEPEYCDELVHRFESNSKQCETHDQGPMSFSQINLNMNMDEWKPDVQILTNVYLKYLEQYKKRLCYHKRNVARQICF